MKKRPFFKHYRMIFENEFKGYNASKFVKDVLAGLTVAAVALPLAIAFGQASVPTDPSFGVIAGMITAIVAGLAIGILGGGSFQISGPTGAMTVVLGGIIASTGIQGMFLACFMAGAILLIAGLLRFGKLIQFIPRPVITGFTSGIALVIAFGQFGNFFGVSLAGESTVDKLVNLFTTQLPALNGEAVTTTVLSVIFTVITTAIIFLYPAKLGKYVPGSLVALILVTVATVLTGVIAPDLADNIKVIGALQGTLINTEILNFGKIDWNTVTTLIGPAFTIAALGMIESLLCGVCAAKMKNEKFDSNVELIAQGIGNMVIPFMGGVPATAAIARTSVAIKSGCQTRITSVMQSVFLIVCIFALPSVIGMIPLSALAGILFATAWKMNDWKVIGSYVKHKLWDAIALFTITMVATVLLDLTYAILIGVVLSFIIMVVNTKIEIEFSPVSKTQMRLTPMSKEDGEEKDGVIVYSTGSLFFANAGELDKQVDSVINDYDHFIFVFRGITYMDVSSLETLEEIVEKLRSKGKTYCFTGVKQRIYGTMEKSGFIALAGEENFFSSLDKVLLTSDANNVYLDKE